MSKGFDVMTTKNGDSFCKMYKECEVDWESFGSHCYRLDNTITKGWIDAEQVCKEKGGHLVSVTSVEENDFIVKLHQTDFLAHFSNLWLGLDMAQAQPQWTDGVDYGYSKFGTPLGTGQGDCVELNQNGEWERGNCTDTRFFICEKD
ncbi:snaclec alboaggregin-A subunit beta'-like [Mya arenaria]|uniref:snaclec alboaggregin-A subunit beta'-like n=1 Tax=Mya arenaria TaxID=6604 RepID=UPI0022E72E14|nr:snaclec alboaggregin-A subunit beta'-like [Mya arenaria]